jgi:integrase
MPRRARDERLDTRAARLRLTPRREPYWRHFQEGRAIGYRRIPGGKAGTWIARFYDPAGDRVRKIHAIGTADDLLDADGVTTLNFGEAQDAAREWFTALTRFQGRIAEPVSVKQAMASYKADYIARGGKALSGLESTIDAHILPKLGTKNLAELTTGTIRQWHRALAIAPPRLRQSKKKGATPKPSRPLAADDTEGHRARRASANRILTVLKAALNLAYADGKVQTDDAWRRVLPFKGAEVARIRHLTDAEAVRLVNAADPAFRPMIVAGLLTGCRYGELTAFRVSDFNPDAATLHVRVSKTGKARFIILTDEGRKFFTTHCTGKTGKALIFTRPDGERWAKSEQIRPMRAACKAASIAPAIGFHILRHTYATRLTMAGVPLGVVASQLGNSEAICAKHYAHLSPGFVADSIRAAFAPLGIVPASNIAPMTG